MKWISSYIATLVALLVLDALWLWLAALPMFQAALGPGLLTFRPIPGVLFYVLYAAGVLLFVERPARRTAMTMLYGAAFGLVAYGTYDLTNYATLKPWTLSLAATDMIWGMVLTALAAAAGTAVARR